jgi:hypothetical protein
VVTIVLPWIDNRLNAHNKGHWRTKAEPTREARLRAYAEAQRAILDGAAHIEGTASVSYRFYVPDNRPRDAANMKQSCKPFIDGVVDSGLITGDHWQVLRDLGSEVAIDKANPRVELTFERIESEDNERQNAKSPKGATVRRKRKREVNLGEPIPEAIILELGGWS